MQIESIALTNVGLVRSMNQDAIMEIADKGVFLVADGMGGEKAGEEASAQVVETLRVKFDAFFKKEPTGPSQIEGEMRDGLLSANRDVFQISVREPDKRGLGSTASLLCLHRGVYFAAQVGDSRIYLMRDGNIHQITRDHTLVWALYEQGAITRDQLETHPDRHLLTQCIGNERPVKVDTFMGQIQEGDTFLICSDGLTGYAKEPKVFDILKLVEVTLKDRADMLIQAALDAGGGDNVSVVLAHVHRLDPEDDWEPEATAPPAKFTDQDAEHAFATSMHHQIIEPEKEEKKSSGMLGWVGVALACIGLIGIFIFLAQNPGGDGSVKVYLPVSPGAPADIQVAISAGNQQLAPQLLQADEKGRFFTLPGPGSYQLQISAVGYLSQQPVSVTVDPDAVNLNLKKMDWVQQPVLTLEIPDSIVVISIEILNRAGIKDDDIIFSREQVANAGRLLEVPIKPDVSYEVVARADGGRQFGPQPLKMTAGEKRTIPIYFGGSI